MTGKHSAKFLSIGDQTRMLLRKRRAPFLTVFRSSVKNSENLTLVQGGVKKATNTKFV